MPGKKLLIILKTGKADRGISATLAFSMGLSSISSLDIETTIFCVGEGSIWAVEGNSGGVSMAGFPPLEELISDFTGAGGKLLVCASCRDTFCTMPEIGGKPDAQLLKKADVVGFTFIAKLATEVPTVTF